MLSQGYAAVSTRQVAKQLGLAPGLIHYYYPTTDELLVAVYRRAADQTLARLEKALASEHPLRALWNINTDAACTGLALEFAALANHRKVIRAELARSFEQAHQLQAAALAQLRFDAGMELHGPLGLTVFLAGIARLIVMENALGMSLGHDEAQFIVDEWIRRLERASNMSERKPQATAPAPRTTAPRPRAAAPSARATAPRPPRRRGIAPGPRAAAPKSRAVAPKRGRAPAARATR
jgi:AcrR family transcriptional regulator